MIEKEDTNCLYLRCWNMNMGWRCTLGSVRIGWLAGQGKFLCLALPKGGIYIQTWLFVGVDDGERT